MSKRIFLIALLGGLLSAAAAYYPLYRWLPGHFVADWPAADERLALTGLTLTLVFWLLTGAFAARQSGTRNRLAAGGAGALAGLIAAWIVEIALGGAAAGVLGAHRMLMYGIHATQDDAEFISLLTHSVLSIVWSIHLSIWAASGLGALLGALGGWAAGSGGKPAENENAFWLMLSALLMPFLAFALIVAILVFALLGPTLQNAANSVGTALPYPAASIFTWPVATYLAWLLLWQVFAWRLTRKAAPLPTLRLPYLLGLALLLSILIALMVPLFSVAAPLVLLAVAALFNWLMPRVRFPSLDFPPQLGCLKAWPERRGDFLRRLGEARLAAWYFFLLSLLTFALALLVTGKTLTHHLWLPLGLGLGVLLGGLGVWETRAKTPSEAGDGEALSGQEDFFALGGLSGLFGALFTGLGIQAPLSLVLIPIVMIAPLRYHEESAALAAATSTLPEIVQQNYCVTGLLLLALLFFAPIYALLFDAVTRLVKNWRNREHLPGTEPQE